MPPESQGEVVLANGNKIQLFISILFLWMKIVNRSCCCSVPRHTVGIRIVLIKFPVLSTGERLHMTRTSFSSCSFCIIGIHSLTGSELDSIKVTSASKFTLTVPIGCFVEGGIERLSEGSVTVVETSVLNFKSSR